MKKYQFLKCNRRVNNYQIHSPPVNITINWEIINNFTKEAIESKQDQESKFTRAKVAPNFGYKMLKISLK